MKKNLHTKDVLHSKLMQDNSNEMSQVSFLNCDEYSQIDSEIILKILPFEIIDATNKIWLHSINISINQLNRDKSTNKIVFIKRNRRNNYNFNLIYYDTICNHLDGHPTQIYTIGWIIFYGKHICIGDNSTGSIDAINKIRDFFLRVQTAKTSIIIQR